MLPSCLGSSVSLLCNVVATTAGSEKVAKVAINWGSFEGPKLYYYWRSWGLLLLGSFKWLREAWGCVSKEGTQNCTKIIIIYVIKIKRGCS